MSTKKNAAAHSTDTKPDEPITFTPHPDLSSKVEAGAAPSEDKPNLDPKPGDIPAGMSSYEWALLGGHKGRDVTKDLEPVTETTEEPKK